MFWTGFLAGFLTATLIAAGLLGRAFLKTRGL